MDDLKGYKIEKCNLKATDTTKIIPSRVANCTPRPFVPFSGGTGLSSSPAFTTPSASPMPPYTSSPLPPVVTPVSYTPPAFLNTAPATFAPSPVAFTATPNSNVQKPTPQLSPKVEDHKQEKVATPVAGSAFSKFVDSIQFPPVFDKQPAAEPTYDEPSFVATVNTSSTSNLNKAAEKEDKKVYSKAEKFAKYIQKKTEKQSETVTASTSALNPGPMYEPVNILTAQLPDVANVTEKGEEEKTEENSFVSKFKEFKTKTISEVTELKTKTKLEVSKVSYKVTKICILYNKKFFITNFKNYL